MFTGIVEELGTVIARTDGEHGTTFRFKASTVLEESFPGASIAVNGCCLTLTDSGDGWWQADAVPETLSRTNLDDVQIGDVVNLERPVRLSDRLGGHLVQGHVDAVGTIVSPAPDLQVRMPADLLRYVVEKGSITVDGCSLTVVKPLPDGFTVALIPHTVEVTTFGRKGIGARVNLEVDVMAKYAEQLIAAYLPASVSSSSSANGSSESLPSASAISKD
jgi:riboflavin synthase